jgi:hypothetical protein
MAFERIWSDDNNGAMAAREMRETVEKNEFEGDNNRQYPNQGSIGSS